MFALPALGAGAFFARMESDVVESLDADRKVILLAEAAQ
ncbi:MAG: hypothetical protein QOF06_1236 [Solirubrobacterales bacterium]|nr:hypothetical protein [Solirubrobacterales bacterium]